MKDLCLVSTNFWQDFLVSNRLKLILKRSYQLITKKLFFYILFRDKYLYNPKLNFTIVITGNTLFMDNYN